MMSQLIEKSVTKITLELFLQSINRISHFLRENVWFQVIPASQLMLFSVIFESKLNICGFTNNLNTSAWPCSEVFPVQEILSVHLSQPPQGSEDDVGDSIDCKSRWFMCAVDAVCGYWAEAVGII